jgi:hypothetical protein
MANKGISRAEPRSRHVVVLLLLRARRMATQWLRQGQRHLSRGEPTDGHRPDGDGVAWLSFEAHHDGAMNINHEETPDS